MLPDLVRRAELRAGSKDVIELIDFDSKSWDEAPALDTHDEWLLDKFRGTLR
jgi:hypothetical protein